MKKILAVGCSYTFGYGLDQGIHDPKLWVNQLFDGIGEVHNLSSPGRNNHWIFLETISALIRHKDVYDIVVVGWSSIPRFNFRVGLELYPVDTMLSSVDVKVNNNVIISGSWLEKIGDNLKKITNDHWDILDLVKYVNVLVELQETMRGKKIFFVNTLAPWCDNYFTRKQINLPSELDPYVQNLLQIETRDDDEILQLYHMTHDHYQRYGGIKESHWLNLYSSLKSMQIDFVSDSDLHPSYLSQEKYVKYLRPILEEKLGAI